MIWTYIKYIRNPFTLMLGVGIKFIFKKIFFKTLDWKDYNELLRLSVELIPAENWYNMYRLLMRVAFTPYNEVTKIDTISGILQNSVFNSNLKKSNLRINEESQDKSWKFFFISIILSGLIKKFYLFVRTFVLLPFKIGTWLFMGGLVGINVNSMINWFEFLRFNIPKLFYNKLLDAHLNWLNLFKGVGQIESISTKDIEEVKLKNLPKTLDLSNSNNEKEPETFFYLTKNQWIGILVVTGITLLICTGIYIKYNFYSDTDKGPGDSPDYAKVYDNIKSKGKLQELNVSSNTGLNTNVNDNLNIVTPSTTVTNINEVKTNEGWISYFKNKISSLIPGKSSSTDLNTPLSQHQHQIAITDNTQPVEMNTVTPNTPKAEIRPTTPNIAVKVQNVPITSRETLIPGFRPWTPDFNSNLGLTQLYTPQGQSVFRFSGEDINPLSTGSLTPKANIVDSLDSPRNNMINPLDSTSTGFSTPKGNTIDPLASTNVESLSPKSTPLPITRSNTPIQNVVEKPLTGSSRPVSPIPNIDNDTGNWI